MKVTETRVTHQNQQTSSSNGASQRLRSALRIRRRSSWHTSRPYSRKINISDVLTGRDAGAQGLRQARGIRLCWGLHGRFEFIVKPCIELDGHRENTTLYRPARLLYFRFIIDELSDLRFTPRDHRDSIRTCSPLLIGC